MSTTPILEPEQQPPPLGMTQQAYRAHSGHGSVGPVIGVLAVIAILGALAVMVGRLCSSLRIMGHGQYDFESWVETKCATCLDGRVDPTPVRVFVPPPPVTVPPETSHVEGEEEKKEEEEEVAGNENAHHERNES